MFRLALLSACLAVSLAAAVNKATEAKAPVTKAWVKPKFCNGIDCPEFEVKEKTDSYELRHYPTAQWVSTEFEANSYVGADMKQNAAFGKLFNYISGQNAAKQKIDMTAPVLIDVVPGPGPNCNSKFIMSFYVPKEFQGKAPKPAETDVYIMNRPALDVYVISFGGYATNSKHLTKTQELAAAVGEDKVDVSMYYTAGYDAPFKWWNRHNESWLKAKTPAQ